MSRGKATDEPNGLLLIDKAQGWTSHDVVAKARRITGQRRIGHTGTLDPMATGLLVLCLGRATRLVEYITGHGKTYEGEVVLGVTTETDDAEGAVVECRPVPELSEAVVAELRQRFTGSVQQVPPAYSAVQVGGERAYAAARRGGALTLAARPVQIDALEIRMLPPDRLGLTVRCGPGTYIRALARDVGEALGCGAHLSALRRTAAGPFRLEQAATLTELQEAVDGGRLAELVLPGDDGLTDHQVAILGSEKAAAIGHGIRLASEGRTDGPLRLYGIDGTFIGVGRLADGYLLAEKILAQAVMLHVDSIGIDSEG